MNVKTSEIKQTFKWDKQPALQKSVLYTCTYIPQEIIAAAGLNAYRIEANSFLRSNDSYFPTNFCPYIKNIANYLLEKKDEIKALILATSCDGMRRLFDITKNYIPDINLFMLDVPRVVSKESIDFFSSNLDLMVSFLDTISAGQKITLESIRSAAVLISEKNRLMGELRHIYLKSDTAISLNEYYDIFKASMMADTGSFNAYLKKYLHDIKDLDAGTVKKKKNIMIMGNYINDEKLWDIFSSLDVKISMDDICFSHRNIVNDINIEKARHKDEALRSIAASYLNKPSCFRMADLDNKVSQALSSIREKEIDALIFISLKFCDTTLYFYPFLKEELKSMKIPTLFLEIEHNKISVGQIKTRIEAFLEMV